MAHNALLIYAPKLDKKELQMVQNDKRLLQILVNSWDKYNGICIEDKMFQRR